MTLENFKVNMHAYKDDMYDAFGRWSRDWDGTEKFVINTSSILTRLIQEAGRYCEHFASDLFIDWQSITENFTDYEYAGGVYLFGFRKDGVDGNNYVLNRCNDGDSARYRSIWRLEIVTRDDEIGMVLGRVS